MLLQGRTYVPLLHARLAELRALRELPESTRPLILPVIRLRPWLNSRTIDKALDNIELSTADRIYGLDLDDFALAHGRDKPAQTEFAALFNDHLGFKNYYDCVEARHNAIPVIRGLSSNNPQFSLQSIRIKEIDRGVFVRVSTENPGAFIEVAHRLSNDNVENVVFIFDCGWGTDILSKAAIAIGLINSLTQVSTEFEVVVAGSSFPDNFARGNRFQIDAQERPLYNTVRSSINVVPIHYGDWGSTRKPVPSSPKVNIPPRIDTASIDHWNSWRGENETFKDVALRVISDPLWDGNIDIWGNYIIQATAQGEEPAIKSATMAAAARINLHMVAQAHLGDSSRVSLGDELVGDDL